MRDTESRTAQKLSGCLPSESVETACPDVSSRRQYAAERGSPAIGSRLQSLSGQIGAVRISDWLDPKVRDRNELRGADKAAADEDAGVVGGLAAVRGGGVGQDPRCDASLEGVDG